MGGWEIVGIKVNEHDEDEDKAELVQKVLWYCPNSINLELSPQHSWEAVDELTINRDLKVDYITCGDVVAEEE